MIIVFGSIGVDLVTNVEHIPHPGETVLCEGYFIVPGSKGANQAVAAARAGSNVMHVASCGDDGFAPLAVSIMKAAGVDLTYVATIARPTAVALITVDEKAENAIVVASGANRATTVAQLERCPFGAGDTVVLQREIPDSETFAAVALAKERGARVVLNVAPAGAVPEETLAGARRARGQRARGAGRGAGGRASRPRIRKRPCARSVARFGCATIVTLGSEGAVGWTGGVRRKVPALAVDAGRHDGGGRQLHRGVRGGPRPRPGVHPGAGARGGGGLARLHETRSAAEHPDKGRDRRRHHGLHALAMLR